jgi:hypothetical protein
LTQNRVNDPVVNDGKAGSAFLSVDITLDSDDMVLASGLTQCYSTKPYTLAGEDYAPFCSCLIDPSLSEAIRAGHRLFSSAGRATFGIKPLVRENLRAVLRDAALCFNLPEDEFLKGDPIANGTTVPPPPASPTPSPRPSIFNEEDPNPNCFPASAQVTLEDGTLRRMDGLSIGDHVQVSATEFSDVFLFTHQLRSSKLRLFVEIEGSSGARLQLTPGHYVYVSGELMTAASVSVGDEIELASGSIDVVIRVGKIWDTGLYNPQTQDGRIVVNGILASTYTRAVDPRLAHLSLALPRAIYALTGGRDVSMGILNGDSLLDPLLRLPAQLSAL